MNAFPVPFRFVATAVLSVILVLIGIMNFRDRALWTMPTDGVFWSENRGALVATEIDPNSPASIAGIRTGEQLNSLNHQPIAEIGQYSDLIYELGSGASVTYNLTDKSGSSRNVTIQLGSKSSLTALDGIRAVLAILHLGIGLFVLFRGGRISQSFHFYFICLAAFVAYLYSYTTKFSPLDWWVYGLSVLAFLLLPALFVHFCFRFPVDAARKLHASYSLYPGLCCSPCCICFG